MDASARRHIDTAVERLLNNLAEAIADDAQGFAPVDTGDLRDSIHAEPATSRRARVVATAGHAAHVELGTRHMDAQPYLRPALYRKRGL